MLLPLSVGTNVGCVPERSGMLFDRVGGVSSGICRTTLLVWSHQDEESLSGCLLLSGVPDPWIRRWNIFYDLQHDFSFPETNFGIYG